MRSYIENWRSPLVMLILMTAVMQLSHQTWHTLLNNYTIHKAEFTGREIGILQSVREVPGFLAFGAVFVLLVMREQTLAYVSLLLLAIGVAMTGFFPSEYGLYATTLLMSIGFHYFETMRQSLSLQWFDKAEAAHNMGKILAAGSFAALGAYGLIYLLWSLMGFDYWVIYTTVGLLSAALLAFIYLNYEMYPQHVEQHKKLILRKRYWLYYALTFMGGARRQIFVVFAGFMMVEKFGYSLGAITTLFLVNHLFNMLFAARIGKLICRFGERKALAVEYVGLIIIFATYAFVESPWLAAALYILDHAFFAMAIAIKTYFQKIADPKDIAPTAGVSFSINHIAAVGLPAVLGFVWLYSPSSVFLIGAGMAGVSLVLALLIPDHPEPGNEHITPFPRQAPAE